MINLTARGDYIGGEFVVPSSLDGEIRRVSPADRRQAIGTFPYASSQVDAAVLAARTAAPRWSATSLEERVSVLARVQEQIERRSAELAELIAMEVGKPLWESRREVAALKSIFDMTVAEAATQLATSVRAEVSGSLVWRPLGVVAVISPFNVPTRSTHARAVPALVAGNTVVVKPSGLTPGVGQVYAELFAAAGIPPGVVNVVQMGGDGASRLAKHPGVGAVQFTGSWAVGRGILSATLDQPQKLVALEMGGKNAAVVLSDADLHVAAREIALGAFTTTGQRCTAISRLIVCRDVAAPLLDHLVRIVRTFKVGHPLDEGVFMGPLSAEAAVVRYRMRIASGEAEGAEPILATRDCDPGYPGSYVSPTIHRVSRRIATSKYQREELFGPDLAVYEASNADEAIELANDTDYGLIASVFTSSDAMWNRLRFELTAGVCCRNRTHVTASMPLPFGGTGMSGNHRPGGAHTIYACARPVTFLEGGAASSRWFLPPFLEAAVG